MALTLLLPPTAKFAGLALPPVLGKALGRADRTRHEAGEAAQLQRHLQPLPARWPAAALSRAGDAGLDATSGSAWLRADPAHLRPDINGARLLGIGRNLGIDQADVDALLPALRPLLGDAGFQLDAPHPERWYLRLPAGTPLPEFAAPEQALGDDLFEHRLEGPQARLWRRLESEVQITLHNHPHNQARLQTGRVPINALWFWGGGVLPDAIASTSPILYSDDPQLRGAAALGKLTCMEPTDFDAASAGTAALVDLRDQRDPRRLLERWLLPACAGAAVLDFADGLQFTLRPMQRWRFWRRPLLALPA